MKPPNTLHRLRTHFVAGLLVVVPGAVSIWVVVKLFDLVTASIPAIAGVIGFGRLVEAHPFISRMVGLVAIAMFIVVVGMLARNVAGKRVIATGEWLVLRVPIFSTVYSTVRQIANAFGANRRGMFRQVVLFEYPKKDCWVVGFETNDAFPEATERVGQTLVGVFVPTTPNPTSGFLLYVPKADLIYLDMSVGDAMRVIVSGGAIHPELPETTNPPAPIL